VGRLLSVVTNVVIGRALGPADYGQLGIVREAANVAAEASDLGLQATAGRELVARTVPLVPLLRAKLLLTAVTVAGGALVAVPRLVGIGSAETGAWLALFAIFVLYFTLAGWTELLGVVLRVRGYRLQEALTILCFRAGLLVLAAGALYLSAGLEMLAWAHAAATLPALVLAGWLVARAQAGDAGGEPAIGIGALLRRALPLGANGVLSLLSVRIELFALGLWVSDLQAGLFASALNILLPLLVFPSAICGGAMPALTREALRGEGPVRARTSLTLALLAAPAAIGLGLVPGVVGVLFGGKYDGAAAILRVLAPLVPVVFMNALLLHALIAVGRPDRVARLTAVRTAVAAVAAVILIPRAGALGAAAGFFTAELSLLLLARYACASAGFPVSVVRPLARGAALSVPMAVALLVASLPPMVEVALGVAIYAATLAIAFKIRPALVISG
jgi:O-antigen/teichoic acid export membrane protein